MKWLGIFEVLRIVTHKEGDWNWLLEVDSCRKWALGNSKALA